MNPQPYRSNPDQFDTPFLGLAPFLRTSVEGGDLRPLGKGMLQQAEQHPDDAELWMNLSVVMQCFGQRDVGLARMADINRSKAELMYRMLALAMASISAGPNPRIVH